MAIKNQTISFVLDGKIAEIDFGRVGLKPTHTLLHYLRSLPNHKGTKEGCGEGDCGACTVVVGEATGNQIEYRAVDSCLVFLPMIHGKQIVTVENLETIVNGKVKLHPVQQAVVEENGTQCGFCTPGVVMSLYALHLNKSKPLVKDIKDALSGNLCRCTGYNAIVKAAQKASVLKESITIPVKENNNTLKMLHLINKNKSTIHIETESKNYYKVFSTDEALVLKKKFPEALIISGATDCALRVTKKHEVIPLIIDISDIEELKKIKKQKEGYLIGASVHIEEVKNAVKKNFPALFDMLSVFGSKQIRNMATLGGNIGSASPIGDTLPVFFAYDGKIVLKNLESERTLPLRTFIESYRKTKIRSDEIITHIYLPLPKDGVFFKSYKISKRKELDISTVSAGFKLELDKKNKVKEIVLAYGGMAAYTKRAVATEAFLVGKTWTESNIMKASLILEKEFAPISDARAGDEMRRIAAKNLLLKFWLDVQV
ncbi:MAG: xanthine dehydrogenase small subunit [Bacteroidales bacterium]|nr:xanthine dehydrogenase small subunit [Bacteroidales bacterium]